MRKVILSLMILSLMALLLSPLGSTARAEDKASQVEEGSGVVEDPAQGQNPPGTQGRGQTQETNTSGALEGKDPRLFLKADGFHDSEGRLVYFRGVNAAGNAKLPPFIPFEDPKWWDLLRSWGFNMVRLTLIWEAIEPQPDVYDQDYLDKVKKLVDDASQRGIYVLLDMHQDLYSRWLKGDGAPYWAFPPQVDPFHNNGFGGRFWGLAYLFSSDTRTCFTYFFRSQELQDHYARAWLEVVRRVKDNPYVLGYDIMNEPSCGDIPNGKGEFENGYLKPFYEKVIRSIREVHSGAICFVEPQVMDMYSSKLTPFSIDGLVYAPHLYNPIANMLRLNLLPDYALLALLFNPLRDKARELGMPLFIGEFGAPWTMQPSYARDMSVNNALMIFEQNFVSNAYWDYSVQDVAVWNEEDFSLIDEEGNPRGLNVNVRPYVRRLNGSPGFQFFGRFTRVYAFSFSGEAGGPPTVVHIPEAIQYPRGFNICLSDGRSEYDPSSGELLYYPARNGAHHLILTPR